jgi:hypothetical protein
MRGCTKGRQEERNHGIHGIHGKKTEETSREEEWSDRGPAPLALR